jgi:hypothetical protein
VLPEILRRLKENPSAWYEANGLPLPEPQAAHLSKG